MANGGVSLEIRMTFRFRREVARRRQNPTAVEQLSAGSVRGRFSKYRQGAFEVNLPSCERLPHKTYRGKKKVHDPFGGTRRHSGAATPPLVICCTSLGEQTFIFRLFL